MTSIIFQNLLDSFYESSNKINLFFDNKKFFENDLFIILLDIPKHKYIIYIIITFIIFNFISRLNIKLNELFSFLISCIVIYFLIRIDYTDFSKYTKNKTEEIRFLHKLMYDNKNEYVTANPDNFFIMPIHPYEKSYLYLDPILVQLFIEVRPISSYNISAYVNSLFHCNNIIGIEYESKIGLNREYLNYNTAILEKSKALNAFNSAIYNQPEATILKYMESLKILQSILNNHLKVIGEYFKNNNILNDITINSVPNDFYDINFFISPDDTKTKDYISVYNMYV